MSEPHNVRRWYEFGALASICTVAPGLWEISELPDWVLNVVYESWHNNPHLKRGEEMEIKFITVAKTKSALVVNLTEDEISTIRAWGVWVCLTEMDKVKYSFKIYQNSVNGTFLLNTMTEVTTRFANDIIE
ncbi:hypothetical protein ACS0TY_020670 [Phlomoides rotata]